MVVTWNTESFMNHTRILQQHLKISGIFTWAWIFGQLLALLFLLHWQVMCIAFRSIRDPEIMAPRL